MSEECMKCEDCGAHFHEPHLVTCPHKEDPTWIEQRRSEQGIRFGRFSRDVDDLTVNPLTRDVAFNRHSMNDGDHVSPTDNATVQVGTDNIRVALVQGINEDDFKRTLSAAVRATVGLDMSQPIDAEGDWEEMLKGGLQTALATQTIVFAVGGVSRTATHQLVRSRRASFHQQSQRAGYMGDAPEVRCPESIFVNPQARVEFFKLAMHSWRTYRYLCDLDISYQDARFALLEGTTNFILLEYPLQEFLNVFAYRGCSMFQWEIVHTMRECRRVLLEAHPWLEPYIKISCEKLQRCTFQGWEDVEGQCDFPWAKHELRTFKPEFHRISRQKPATA